jgi:hypothetical protein
MLSIVMLTIVMLSIVMLSFVMLTIVMLNVVAPAGKDCHGQTLQLITNICKLRS